MYAPRLYGFVRMRSFRTELPCCPTCQLRLRRFAILSCRTIIPRAGTEADDVL